MTLEAPLQRGGEVVLVAGDVHGTGDPDLHRVENPAASLDIALELRDKAERLLRQVVLPEQQIVAALGDLAHRTGAAGAHPERRGGAPAAPPPRPAWVVLAA